MVRQDLAGSLILLDRDMEAPETVDFCGGTVVYFGAKRPGREGPNEDGALLVRIDADAGVLAVADGAGGLPSGSRASGLALERLAGAFEEGVPVRESILRGFDLANEAVAGLAVGAATTLAVASLRGRTVRAYHAGDSLVLVVGQRGKRKLETVSHSPVGYAVEAGVINEREAMHHEERHLVSNLVGAGDMRVEIGPRIELAARDTLLVASDGLSDNLHLDEVTETIRKGPLAKAAARLAATARARMESESGTRPSKPDDLTFVLYRPRRHASGTKA